MAILNALVTSGLIFIAASQPAADASAKGLVDIFDQTCIAYAGRQAQLKVWLDVNMQQANEHQTPYFLGALGGKVWLSSNSGGNYAVIVYDLGLCTVKAEKGPIDDALKDFEEQAKSKLHLTLTRTGDDPAGVFQDIAGHTRTYSTQIDGISYAIVASGTETAPGPLQSQFTLMLHGQDKDGNQ